MTKRMLIEATHPEETRVVVVDGKRLEEFDYESANKRQLKGNIYLAKVTRVEPSLQAAFVDYGGNRHGFLAFSEIHPDYYRIPVADREALLAEHAAMAAEEAASEAEEDLAANTRADLAAGTGDLASDVESTAGPRGTGDGDAAEAGDPSEVDDSEVGDGEAMPLRMASEKLLGPEIESGEAAAIETVAEESEDGEDNVAETPATTTPDEGERAPAPQETAGSATTLETLGGDEAEDVRRRRSRPLRRYKIQEVIKRRQIMLVQVTKEERGNKGAALTTYLSLAGRYCVLMPNTGRGGGISRKITSAIDRKRLKSILGEFEIPDGMAVIVRTAGSERNKTELRRDYEYLLRLWDEIRQLTLQSTAPTLIYEEASLIKRAIRDLYSRDIEEVLVEGEDGYKAAKNFMRTLMPSHAKRVQLSKDESSHLFHRFQVESQLDAIHNPVVGLRSGGYIVINSTEALVAIDVNSGRATRERNIEETALRTNQEAADEIARQLRLRDLAGLIVIDFIDMEENRNNAAVERRLKEAMRHDRARIQVGRISPFGLLELSRQRLRPSLIEASTEICRHCRGTGHVRSTESTALHVLRGIEEEGIRNRSAALNITVPTAVALYILNNKRAALAELEQRHNLRLTVGGDDTLIPPDYRMERLKTLAVAAEVRQPISQPDIVAEDEDISEEDDEAPAPEAQAPDAGGARRRSRRRRRRRDDGRPLPVGDAPGRVAQQPLSDPNASDEGTAGDERTEVDEGTLTGEAAATARPIAELQDQEGESGRRRRRRGRRGGRRRRRGGERPAGSVVTDEGGVAAASADDSESTNGEGWVGEDESWATEDPAADAPREHTAEPPAYHDQAWPPGDRLGDEPADNGDHDDGPRPEPADDLRTDAATDRPEAVSGETPSLHGAADFSGNGSAPSAPADAEAEADVESSGQQPAGPARRGWWKRLIE
ncbi:MAG: ribonuclease E/G [Dongiaceae bacterium]